VAAGHDVHGGVEQEKEKGAFLNLRSGAQCVSLDGMDVVLRYRGRTVTDADVAFVDSLIADHPDASRRALSRMLCEAWHWVQANGSPCDMVCRGLMLALHRGGHITLPPVRKVMPNPLAVRKPATPVELAEDALCAPLREIGPVTIEQVRRTRAEALVVGLIERYHYLGYVQPVGEHLKYLASAGGRPVACFAWSSAQLHLGPRDQHIGWSHEARRKNLHLVAYQSRFLILPWVRVPHLASHLLGRMSRQLSADWERVYAHPVKSTTARPSSIRTGSAARATGRRIGRISG
jgi:hypothetical protein